MVFKGKENAQIATYAKEEKKHPDWLLSEAQHSLTERIVDQDGEEDNGYIAWIVVSIKDKGCQDKEDLVEGTLRCPAQKKVDEQC